MTKEDNMMAPITKMTALGRLVEAAEPFVKHNSSWMDRYPDADNNTTYPVHSFGELRRLVSALEAAKFLLRHSPQWECAGRRQTLPEPGECDWPVCGCDPAADKVIEALEERGALSLSRPQHSTPEE